jgi:hypothetical protein
MYVILRAASVATVLVAPAVFDGCGGTTSPGNGGTKANVCPSDQPSHGDSCSVDASLACEYGNDARPGCRTHATCPSGSWRVAVSGCPPLPVAGQNGCPATPPDGGACSNDGLICDMGSDAFCACSACAGGPCSLTPRWVCGGPPTLSGCPSRAPALGSACTEPNLVCVYGPTCVGSVAAGRRCKDGAWVDEPLACPV